MSPEPRYTVTRLDGYAASSSSRGDGDAAPGASFHVLDGLTGQLVAVYRSEETSAGLPPVARIRLAERRAREHAGRLEVAAIAPSST